MALWGDGSERGQGPLPTFLSGRKLSSTSLLDTRYFSSSLYATGAFQAAILVLELRASIRPFVSSLRGTAWTSRSFFHQLSPHWFLQPEVMRTYLPSTGTLGLGVLFGARIPHSKDIPSKFLSTTAVYGTSPFHVSTPPTSLDGCGFFNSVVVRLPFNLISDSSG